MRLERRLVAARLMGRRLAFSLTLGDVDDALETVWHLRRSLHRSLAQLDRLEARLDPMMDPFGDTPRHYRQREGER